MVDTQGKKSKVLLSPLSSSFLFSRRCLSRAFSLNKVHCVFVCLTESHPSPVPGRSIITVALPSSMPANALLITLCMCLCVCAYQIPKYHHLRSLVIAVYISCHLFRSETRSSGCAHTNRDTHESG